MKMRMQIHSSQVAENAEVDRPVNPADMANKGFIVNSPFSNKTKATNRQKPKKRK